ncbi:MAG: NAD(+) synthase [Clostridia bacterium]|nr:NAD(+) synthase [Clostridia bacterium]
MNEIIEILKKARRERGVTLKELSQASGVSLGTVNKLFSGAIASVKVQTANKLATALGVSLSSVGQTSEINATCVIEENYGLVRCAALTNEVKVGNVDFNVNSTIELIAKANKLGVSLAVFPELNLTAYTAGDLLFQEALLTGAMEGLKRVAKATEGISMLVFVGLPIKHTGRLYNCAAAICNGEILAIIPKKNLPNYGEFYEKRWFCEADEQVSTIYIDKKPIPFGYKIVLENALMPQMRVACELCEDLWVVNSPSIAHCREGATIIANLSASNEIAGKKHYRKKMLSMHASKCLCVYIYSSSGKGESSTDLVFGGHNIICDAGECLAESKPFENGIAIADVDCGLIEHERIVKLKLPADLTDYCHITYSALNKRKGLLREYSKTPFVPTTEQEIAELCEDVLTIQAQGLLKRMEHINAKKLVLGLSGGLDSTLAMLVCEKALKLADRNPEDLIAITMPCFGTSNRTYNNACVIASELKCSFIEINIKASVMQHFSDIGQDCSVSDITYENSQARERTQVLMDYANKVGGMVIGTGDLSEMALGWATYNGDHMSMYSVNCSVPKTLVKQMVLYFAKKRGGKLGQVLSDIADTPISPELKPSKNGEITQPTENFVGPYVLNDFYLYHILKNGFLPSKVFYLCRNTFKGEYDDKTILKWLENFIKRFFTQQFKRSCSPDGVKACVVSLSPRGDLRMPSDACYDLWMEDLQKIKSTLAENN